MKFKRLVVIILLLAAIWGCTKKEEPAKVEPPPPEIQVFVTKSQDIPIFKEFVGQVYGMEDIDIRARVEGFLESIHFQEGSRVKKGDLLYTLDSQPFDADVAEKMSRVAEAKTVMGKAESDLKRIQPLAEKRAVSQRDLDAAVASFEAAKSSVKAAESVLKAAKIQRGYTRIYSPIDGIIGKTMARVGDFVGRSFDSVILNTVSRVDTVQVEFFITETEYLQFARHVLGKSESMDLDDRERGLELILADGSLYKHKGKGDFINREVDPTTGAILIRASFPNPDELLRPGQFARVRARERVVKDGILIPQRCVIELQELHSVYVAGGDNKIERRDIKTGPKVGSFWLVTEGLKQGEKVVYEGLQKVKEGAVVKPIIKAIDPPNEKNG